jgi:LmbE family N-acetylglucosaminyl deacetylase
LGLKLMCVVAHPDDECFGFGGALALASDHGVETYVVCLTDGQAASNRGTAESNESLGRMRRKEFHDSCRVLGVMHDELMDYQDAQLEFAEFSHVACRLVERMRRFRPDVVITFGADGAQNSHPDHTMVSAFASAAFHWAQNPKRFPQAGTPHQAQRLYHLTADVHLPGRLPAMMLPWSAKLDIRAVRDRKTEAFRAHVSQAPLMEKTKDFFEEHGDYEFYTLMAASNTQPMQQQADLFEGLTPCASVSADSVK